MHHIIPPPGCKQAPPSLTARCHPPADPLSPPYGFVLLQRNLSFPNFLIKKFTILYPAHYMPAAKRIDRQGQSSFQRRL